jgi:hypothetical protein
MEQSPSSEANNFSASQDIPHILHNPNVCSCVHNNLQPDSILNQLM